MFVKGCGIGTSWGVCLLFLLKGASAIVIIRAKRKLYPVKDDIFSEKQT